MKNDLEELSVAARRGELPKASEQDLESLFAEAPDERIWHEAGLRFDSQDVPAPSDEDVERRLLERVLTGQPSALPRPRRVRAVLPMAAAVLVVSAAATAAVVGVTHLRQPPTTPAANPAAGRSNSFSAAPRVEPAPTRAPVVEPEAPTTEPGAPASANVAPADPAPLRSEQVHDTAADLLSSAGQARRKGETARAVTLLEALQSRFPGSAEARASDITLGMLRLQLGATGAALNDFDRYLTRSPNGDRTADALWGRSKALLALKRRAEAAESLRQLLARYPNSPFVSAARAELGQVTP